MSHFNKPPLPGYFTVIPAPVRYDTQLEPAAKLLYGELSALVNREGYCNASDSYLAKLCLIRKAATAGAWLEQLERGGYIRIAHVPTGEPDETARRIYLSGTIEHYQEGR